MSLRNLLVKLLGAAKGMAAAAVTVGSAALTVSTSVLAAALIIYSSYVLYDTVSIQNNARANTADLIAFKPEEVAELDVPLSTLGDINPDYTGWLTLDDTEIDYPVMQGENDIFYAFHDIYKNESQTGSIYMSASNTSDYSDNYNLLYGHDMAAGMMFGGLHNYLKEEGYLEAHKTGVLISRDLIYDLEVFAAILTDAYEANVYNVGNRDLSELMAYIDSLPDDEKVISPSLPENADKILALSTCASGAATYGRVVVFATMKVRPKITLEVVDYSGEYDGQEHYASVTTNMTDGVTITYSYDDGVTWTEEVPSIQNVGEKHFQVCAYHERYGLVTAPASLKVTPKKVTVTADNTEKAYDTQDPTFTATYDGLLPGDSPDDFTVSFNREPGEDVGTYSVTPAGDVMQGNYELVFVSGELTIKQSDVLRVTGIDYIGVYDGQPHTVGASYNTSEVTGDILIEYSLDGVYWTADPMEFASTVPMNVTVKVRGTSKNYVTSEDTAVLQLSPREIRAVVNNAVKVYGDADPDFTVTYEGLLPVDSPDDFTVSFTREPGENVGTYTVTPHGEQQQGSYYITFVPGTLEITPANTLKVAVTDIEGTYTGAPYYSTAVANIPEGTTIKYSDDGGKTWHTDPSEVAQTDAGSKTVLVRAENPNYEPYETSYEINVRRAPVTITVNKAEKIYGSADPQEYAVTINGVLDDDFVPVYTIVRTNANEENVGFYPGVLHISGEANQGNYEITFVDGDFEILKSSGLTVEAEGFDGVYDGEEHSVSVTPKIDGQQIDDETAKDLEIWYSTDGGETWTKDAPSVKNANTYDDDDPGLEVMVKVTHPNYGDAVETVYLKIDPKTVVVKADTVRIAVGARNPEFTATVSGLIDGDTIEYTVVCTTTATEAGYYTDVIVPMGDERQGNYRVRYIPGDLIIYEDANDPPQPPPDNPPVEPGGNPPDEPVNPPQNPDHSEVTPEGPVNPDNPPDNPSDNPPDSTENPPDTTDNPPDTTDDPTDHTDTPENPPEENPDDSGQPIVNWVERFKPAGSDTIFGGRSWALVNLLCVLVTLYLFLPLLHLKAKFSRRYLMKKVNEEKKELLTLQELQEEQERERERIERLALDQRQNHRDTSAAVGGSENKQPPVTREEFDRAVEDLYYRIKRFTRRFRIGMVLELADVVLAAVIFYFTEDMRLPMVLIDKWTPLMILLLALCWIVDIRLARYRSKVLADEEEEIAEQMKELADTTGET